MATGLRHTGTPCLYCSRMGKPRRKKNAEKKLGALQLHGRVDHRPELLEEEHDVDLFPNIVDKREAGDFLHE